MKGGAEIYIQGVYIYAYVVHYVCMNIMFEVVLWNVRRSFNGHLTSKCCGNKVRDSLPKYWYFSLAEHPLKSNISIWQQIFWQVTIGFWLHTIRCEIGRMSSTPRTGTLSFIDNFGCFLAECRSLQLLILEVACFQVASHIYSSRADIAETGLSWNYWFTISKNSVSIKRITISIPDGVALQAAELQTGILAVSKQVVISCQAWQHPFRMSRIKIKLFSQKSKFK